MMTSCGSARLSMGVMLFLVFLLPGCASSVPGNPDNLCAIFEEKPDWHEAALDAREKWGAPVHVTMAILRQESSFRADAQPPMEFFLGILPIGRASDAYGYPQAKDAVWDEYQTETGNSFADRDDFDDAMDFVGWYISKTSRVNKVSKWDAYGQYLNYHEGHGGYRRKSHMKKPWLLKVARKVERQAKRYSEQYWKCKDSLGKGSLLDFF